MKKFFISTTIPGSLYFFSGQARRWAEVFDVCAISSDISGLKKFASEEGVRYKYIPIRRNISLFSDFANLFRYFFFFVKERPYIVHGNTPKAALLSMMAAWLARVPVRIYMCHGLRFQGCSGSTGKLLRIMEKITCYCATDIICVSQGIKEALVSEKITKKTPVVVWNGSVCGIDSKRFDPNRNWDRAGLRTENGIGKDDYVLTFVGRIVKDKGIEELISAFTVLSEKYKHIQLLLVGGLEDEGNAISEETKAKIKGNGKIIYVGKQENVPAYLSITDLFVFPTYREGFGLSLMEALAMEIPCISTDVIGCKEILIEGETGLFIPPRSSESIVDAVERLYNDKELYIRMKSQCRSSVVSRYEKEQLQEAYFNYYIKK